MNKEDISEKNLAAANKVWTRQLINEFETICDDRQISLLCPVFEISTSKKVMGAWYQNSKTIKISHYLILEYSWDVVINVLKHEMSHMLCTELFKEHKCGHNQVFQKACILLNVPKKFRKASSDLSEDIIKVCLKDNLSEDGSKIITKVKKLLALAGSENEHEAALAMQKACNIMTSHNIKQLEQDFKNGYDYLIITTGKKQLAAYRRSLCAILRDFFHVQVVCSTLYDPHSDTNFKSIELLGRTENISIAEHCYYFMENRLATLWSQNKNKWPGNKRTVRNSYYLGILHGFRQKMTQQVQQTDFSQTKDTNAINLPSNVNSLLIQEDKRLLDFMANRFPRLKNSRSNNRNIYKQTFEDAVITGKKINLHLAINQTKKTKVTLMLQ